MVVGDGSGVLAVQTRGAVALAGEDIRTWPRGGVGAGAVGAASIRAGWCWSTLMAPWIRGPSSVAVSRNWWCARRGGPCRPDEAGADRLDSQAAIGTWRLDAGGGGHVGGFGDHDIFAKNWATRRCGSRWLRSG